MKLISLRFPEKLLEGIDKLVEQGHYANRTDALRDAARVLLRSNIGIIQGKPLDIPKDDIWDTLIKNTKE